MRTEADPQPLSADRHRVEAALAVAAEVGPFFAQHRDASAVPLSPEQLYEPRRLNSVLDAIGHQLGTREGRVAAFTLQYGVAARCWSLILGAWQCGRVIIDMRGLGFVVAAPGTVELTLTDVRAWDSASLTADEVAELIADTVTGHVLADLHTALRTVLRVADGLLWGNAASALVSATRTLYARQPSEELTAVTTAILSRAPLADRLVRTSGGSVLRRSCCLWYRTRHRDNCGDCPLSAARQ
ncbi:(2Fe-2S)-binding protein [Mycobacterium hubeiense]|uniref:(2Fe-2S)-binding protein n=1 Tax=Mycobacterium hubeiense TaxID=1867256 RepID=UPI000C7E8CCC|nr:(2Fe-2S)-binding protein [Mycobacterium sp. QGD 101]